MIVHPNYAGRASGGQVPSLKIGPVGAIGNASATDDISISTKVTCKENRTTHIATGVPIPAKPFVTVAQTSGRPAGRIRLPPPAESGTTAMTGTLGRTLKALEEGEGPELELDAEAETEDEAEGVGSLNLTL